MEKITITKEISKKGNNTVVFIPKSLQRVLKHKTLCKITFELSDNPKVVM
jgi:antitoxin component of MazEF toxin-antitoxin module